MSDALDTAYVEIQPDFSDFNREVQTGVRDASRDLERSLTSTLDDLEGEFADFADDAVTEVQSALERIADAGEDSADEIEAAYDDVDTAIREAFDRGQRAASDAFDQIERDAEDAFDSVRDDAERAGRETEESFQGTGSGIEDSIGGATESAGSGFLGMADNAVGAGLDIRGAMGAAAGAAGIGAIIAAAAVAAEAFIDMAQEALELEGSLTRISSASAEGFSPAAVDGYREGLRDLQNELGILTEDSAPALQAALAQGVPEDNAIEFLNTAAQTAIATGSDLEDTVTVLNGLTSQFSDDLGTTAEAADFLTVTLGNTTADAADVGDVIGEISGFARDAGVGVDELGAALAAMSITGRDAGTSGGQLAAFVEELGDATTPVAEAFDELAGQSFQEFIAQGGTVQEAAQLIADGAADAGQSVVELAGSAETSSAVLALSTEEGAKRFNDALAETRDGVGATEDTFGNLEDSGALAFDQLEGSIQSLRDIAGEAVAPLIAEFIDELIPVIEEVSPLIAAVGETLFEAFGAAAEFISPLVEIIFGLFEALSPVLELLTPLFEILSLIGEIVGNILVPVFEVLFAILGPIFEVVATLLTPALELISLLFEEIASIVSEYVAPFLVSLAADISETLAPMLEWLTEQVDRGRLAFQLIVNWVKDNWGAITGVIAVGVDAVQGFFSSMESTIRGIINSIIDAWNSIDLSFSVSIPDWVPNIGGNSFSVDDVVPDIPRLQTGGFTTDTGLAQLHPDEMVLPLTSSTGINALADAMERAGGGGGDVQVIVKIGERELTDIVDTQVSRNNRTLTRRARAGTGRN